MGSYSKSSSSQRHSSSVDKAGRVHSSDGTIDESGRESSNTSLVQSRGWISQGFATNLVLSLLMVIAICAIIMVSELGSVIHSQHFAQESSSGAKTVESHDLDKPASNYSTTPPYNHYADDAGGSTTDNAYGSTTDDDHQAADETVVDGQDETAHDTSGSSFLVPNDLVTLNDQGENVCAGKKPDLPNTDCIVDAMVNVGPQAGANVTAGYQGLMNVTDEPILVPFWQVGMCAVNVHWHFGAEHLSVGEYDETGVGPTEEETSDGYAHTADGEIEGREGHRCKLYDETDSRFTEPYEWKYCHNMVVGETYEVHWPHSAAGACGTPNQYQTPFYDGVFCVDGILDDTASQIGVQAQVFVVVNDDAYYFPDLIRGMIVDGDMGYDVAKYTGSTTGDSVNNEICSQYSPITWQVDRKCHLISASSFDKLCYDMLQQRDDMSEDIHPHGSRETVSDELAANNQHGRHFLRGL